MPPTSTCASPRTGETVALLVSDRHDNIGMDRVARAIGDAVGAEVVLDAGDDTSTGAPWEAFSLDSLAGAFEDWDRFGVAGNHDHGTFVSTYLADQGWTMLDGEAVEAPWGGTLLGVDDPRSSGLGSWRDESGLSFTEVGERLADAACAAAEDGERVSTVLVHDANLGRRGARAAAASTWCWAATPTSRPGPTSSRPRTVPPATRGPTAPPAERRTPSRSAASRAATPTSAW